MKNKLILLICISFIIAACSKSNKKLSFTEPVFNDKTHITATVLNDTYLFSHPKNIFIVDSLLIINDYIKQNKIFHVFNKNTGEHITSFGNKGRGGGEIISVGNATLMKDNSIMVFDEQTKKIIIYDIAKIINNTTPNYKEFSISNAPNKIWETLPYGNDFLINGYDDRMRYGRFDPLSGDICILSKDLPILTEDKEENWSVLNYSAKWRMKPDETKMVLGTYIGMSMEILDFKNGIITQDTLCMMRKPIYDIAEGATPKWVTHNDETLMGFRDMYVTDKYIYTLMHQPTPGTDISNLIAIFDWKGNPTKEYEVDELLLTLAVDEKENTIYALDYNYEGVYLLKYEID